LTEVVSHDSLDNFVGDKGYIKKFKLKEGKAMRKILLSMVCLSVLVFALAGTSYAWQGRMGGAGDPYGLLSDESDFLIHPAKIANGEGIKFYGHYRLTYTDVMDWDYDLDLLTPAGVFLTFFDYETSGQEYNNNALLGAATPLGPGRFGIFFTYDGMRGDYDGSEDVLGMSNYAEYDLTKDFDNFALRLLYGLPIGSFKLGGEAQCAYRQEENKNWINLTDMSSGLLNYPGGGDDPTSNLFPFMIPYDSSYWEALFKGSLEGKVGPLDLEFTLRGGFLFSGNNNYEYDAQQPVGTSTAGLAMDGGVQGWRIGGDLWARYSLVQDFSLPFLVRVDYHAKKRDGDGVGSGLLNVNYYGYEHEENNFQIEAGGGIDKQIGQGTTIAAGIYYNYLQGVNDLWIWGDDVRFGIFTYHYNDYPSHKEHQVVVRFTGEHEFSSMVALRMGLGFFYGWVQQHFEQTVAGGGPFNFNDDISPDGYHLGIEGSLGGSLSFNNFTMEPFINGGWQQYDLTGDGATTLGGVLVNTLGMDLSRDEWYIGGGCSFLYDMP
jgi:hypothetical protein